MAWHPKSARTTTPLTLIVLIAASLLCLAAPAQAATGTIADVRHVVILMQENRSFDHYFGSLKGVRGFNDRTALRFQNGYSVFHQPRNPGFVLPYHTAAQCLNDVEHDWDGLHEVWNSGKMDRWVTGNGPVAMAYHTRQDLPYYYALADAYTICDANFCSVLGPTFPNRLYFFSGTIDPNGLGGGPAIDNSVPPGGFTWTTYPERLQTAGVSWQVYRPIGDWIGDGLAWFSSFRNATPGNPLYDRGLAVVGDVVSAFRRDVTNGTLPQVSWIVAPLVLTEHPPYPPADGEAFTKQILDVIMSKPEVYNSTVFILTYDENGGFFDHVPPPVPPPGTPDEFVNGVPIGLGYRMPMLVVSPWSRGGQVCSAVLDNTSIIRFLEKWTGVTETNISAWRRNLCGDLLAAFDFAHPDTTLPVLPGVAPVICMGNESPQPPVSQSMPMQEFGVKKSRALPYQPNATSFADCANGRFYVSLANAGAASAHFTIYPYAYRTDGPWHYDVGPGGSVTESFQVSTNSAGGYDLACFGPNGFLRRFAGGTSSNCNQLEISSAIDPSEGSFTLTFTNSTAKPVTYKVTDGYWMAGPWNYGVPAGGTLTKTFLADTNHVGWYDLTVTVDADRSFLRRLAGHIETGEITESRNVVVSALSAEAVQGNLILSYPDALSNYTLESSTNPIANSWSTTGVTPTKDSNGDNVVTIPITTQSQFFRLRP